MLWFCGFPLMYVHTHTYTHNASCMRLNTLQYHGRAAAVAQQRVHSASRQLAHLRHQLDHLDTMLGRQRPRAESCLAGRAKGCGAYRDGSSAWYPPGRVVYDAEDYSLFDNVVCCGGCAQTPRRHTSQTYMFVLLAVQMTTHPGFAATCFCVCWLHVDVFLALKHGACAWYRMRPASIPTCQLGAMSWLQLLREQYPRPQQCVCASLHTYCAPVNCTQDAFLQRMAADLARRKAHKKQALSALADASAAVAQRARDCSAVRCVDWCFTGGCAVNQATFYHTMWSTPTGRRWRLRLGRTRGLPCWHAVKAWKTRLRLRQAVSMQMH